MSILASDKPAIYNEENLHYIIPDSITLTATHPKEYRESLVEEVLSRPSKSNVTSCNV